MRQLLHLQQSLKAMETPYKSPHRSTRWIMYGLDLFQLLLTSNKKWNLFHHTQFAMRLIWTSPSPRALHSEVTGARLRVFAGYGMKEDIRVIKEQHCSNPTGTPIYPENKKEKKEETVMDEKDKKKKKKSPRWKDFVALRFELVETPAGDGDTSGSLGGYFFLFILIFFICKNILALLFREI